MLFTSFESPNLQLFRPPRTGGVVALYDGHALFSEKKFEFHSSGTRELNDM